MDKGSLRGCYLEDCQHGLAHVVKACDAPLRPLPVLSVGVMVMSRGVIMWGLYFCLFVFTVNVTVTVKVTVRVYRPADCAIGTLVEATTGLRLQWGLAW